MNKTLNLNNVPSLGVIPYWDTSNLILSAGTAVKHPIVLFKKINTRVASDEENLYREYESFTSGKIINAGRKFTANVDFGSRVSNRIDDIPEIVDRFTIDTKNLLRSCLCFVAVNPVSKESVAARMSSEVTFLVVVLTAEGSRRIDADALEYADFIICHRSREGDIPRTARAVGLYDNIAYVMPQIEAYLMNFFEKERYPKNAIPVIGRDAFKKSQEDTFLKEIDQVFETDDIVVFLGADADLKLGANISFRAYTQTVSDYIEGLVVSEVVWHRYSNLVRNINGLGIKAKFLEISARDGYRIKYYYG